MLNAVFHAGRWPQCLIHGDLSGLNGFADAAFSAVNIDLDPIDTGGLCLHEVEFHLDKGMNGIVVRVDTVGHHLVISGPHEGISEFAENIRGVMEQPAGTHQHLEWFEGDDLFVEGSLPLVVSRI